MVALSLGGYHSCAVLDNGLAKCWGLNEYGQLGLGDTNDHGDSAGEMGDALPYICVVTTCTGTDIKCILDSLDTVKGRTQVQRGI